MLYLNKADKLDRMEVEGRRRDEHLDLLSCFNFRLEAVLVLRYCSTFFHASNEPTGI